MEQADCPYRAAGLGATHCGPLNDDFETHRGWTVNPGGGDTATDGGWARGIPARTSDSAGVKQKPTVPSGQADLVTGRTAGGGVAANDVDSGTTSARSVDFRLGGGSWRLSFNYTFAHDAGASSDDLLRVSVVDGGTVTPLWTVAGQPANRNAQWLSKTVNLDSWAGQTVRLLVEARDGGADNIVEAAVDNVRVYAAP
jgi:hypothetical protein